jgi:hypothetical protein
MHDFFRKHGGKERKKEQAGPAFLSFDPFAQTLAGSLRRSPAVPCAPQSARGARPSKLPGLVRAVNVGRAASECSSSPAERRIEACESSLPPSPISARSRQSRQSSPSKVFHGCRPLWLEARNRSRGVS